MTERLISLEDTARRYGKKVRTIDQWLAKRELEFPKPLHRFGRRWWLEGELRQFEARYSDRLGVVSEDASAA